MNTRPPFVHLHLHTSYSLLDGACRVEQTIARAAEEEMPAVAITDHGVLYGMIDFYKTARDRGVKPLLGCEAYILPRGSSLEKKTDGARVPLHHLVLLAEDNTGYANLTKLITHAHLDGYYYKPRIDKEVLARYHQGLIGLSACLHGEIASCLLGDDTSGAEKAAGDYAEILGKDHFFLEVQDNGLPDQDKVNGLIGDLSKKTGIPVVATNDVHYLRKEHAAAHEVLLCLQTQTVLSDPNRMRFSTDQLYMKSAAEMEPLFLRFPGSRERTLEIAGRCNVELEFGTLHFPIFEVPKGTTQKATLIQLAKEGLLNRYGVKSTDHPADAREKEIVDRFNHELAVIEKTRYINYYLVVWDFVNFARKSGIPVGPGRGSGGGSLLAYALGITSIDPLKYGLIFERFLNPERVSPPDFDIDFCQARREEVIEYVKNKYGRDNVAQIITFGSLGAKTVIRDVGRVLEIPFAKCDQIAKLVPEDPKITLESALKDNPDFKKAYETDPDCKRILDYGFVLEGLYRNQGTHAAGVVIGEKRLSDLIPLARDKEKQVITQYAMEPLGSLGLLKMDFLGLKTLTVIKEALDLIRETRSVALDPDTFPLDNKPAYDLLNRGDTVGVFQLESSGMRDLIRRVGIHRIEDLIAMIALYRPGPMNMLEDYSNRKNGKAKIAYDHPLMEPILEETYGIMIYQEQVQKVASVLAGYSLGNADLLRRAMGKKKIEAMEAERAHFVEGCAKTQHIPHKQAEKIFGNMARFAGYGFNKSHSAAYAIISYQTAYLKANYPEEFMAALLSSEMGNSDKLPVFINEAMEMDLKILPPDVNESGVRFRPVPGGVRFGLAGIKNIGEGAAETLTAERARNGRFTGLVHFCSRLESQLINKKVIESLVRSGAFDSLEPNRARLFQAVEQAMARAARAAADRRSGQSSLFDLMADAPGGAAAEDLPDAPPWHESKLLSDEKELLGIYMSGHPLTRHATLLNRYQLTTVAQMTALVDRTPTRIGGIISQLRKTFTKKKDPMAILQLEDLDGAVEVVVFPETYDACKDALVPDSAILVCGEISRKEDQPKIIAQEIYPIADAPKLFATRLSVHIPAAAVDNGRLEKLKGLLLAHPGRAPVSLCLQYPTGEKVFLDTESSLKVLPDEDLVRAIEHEFGEKSVYVAVNPSPCAKPPKPRNGRGKFNGFRDRN